jgi:hypothetical protein
VSADVPIQIKELKLTRRISSKHFSTAGDLRSPGTASVSFILTFKAPNNARAIFTVIAALLPGSLCRLFAVK